MSGGCDQVKQAKVWIDFIRTKRPKFHLLFSLHGIKRFLGFIENIIDLGYSICEGSKATLNLLKLTKRLFGPVLKHLKSCFFCTKAIAEAFGY